MKLAETCTEWDLRIQNYARIIEEPSTVRKDNYLFSGSLATNENRQQEICDFLDNDANFIKQAPFRQTDCLFMKLADYCRATEVDERATREHYKQLVKDSASPKLGRPWYILLSPKGDEMLIVESKYKSKNGKSEFAVIDPLLTNPHHFEESLKI